jgi:hypothetical protein
MNIPKEAVEAAGGVLVYHQRRDISSCMCGWSELGRSHAAHQAELALEAAAQHIRAAAWEEGMLAMYESTSSEWPPIPEQNPYRTTK